MSFSQKAPLHRPVIDFSDDQGLTEQHHKESCDIHNILKKSEQTGIIEHTAKYQGQYGVMPTGNEFHAHMNAIATAETMFESIPAKIRNEFNNSPAEFLDFIQDPKNKEKIEAIGLDSSHLPEIKLETKPEVEKSVE